MTRIKMHIAKAKLPFYLPGEIKCRLQNGVSTMTCMSYFIFIFFKVKTDMGWTEIL